LAAYRERLIQRRWVHSHEEDTDDEMVFRPEGHPLPPSRGRTSFELRPDGTYVESSPGPVDAPEESAGSWSLEGDRLILGAEGDRPGHAWEITGAEDDRLTVRK
jgi:hypothetical protein